MAEIIPPEDVIKDEPTGAVVNKTNDEKVPLNTFSVPSSVVADEIPHTLHYNVKHATATPRGADKVDNGSGKSIENKIEPNVHSQFSDYHLFRIKSANGQNYPLTDVEAAKTDFYKVVKPIDLVNRKADGADIYKAEDFMYVKDYQRLPINRLITLRRFAYPVVDDIFSNAPDTEPDICRLLTYADQDNNKFSDIMSFSMGMRWKPLTSSMEAMQMHGPQSGVTGVMKSILNFVDPTFGQDALRGDTALDFNPMHDSNKVYGPVDSIDSSHIRDIGLDFEQEIKLAFTFNMRSIEGVNQKAAFIDLLSTVFLMTTNDAKFWGGARFWQGRRPTKYLHDLRFLSPTSFSNFLDGAHKSFTSFVNTSAGGSEGALAVLKNIASNAFNLGFGKLLDKVGRPSIPFTNSLLSNSPVGLWHVTIGNPLNPTMAIGNLIMTGSSLMFSDELGIDDFPDSFTVECTLKHAMPRGRAEIEQMFNSGMGRTYWKPKDVHGSMPGTKIAPHKKGSEVEPVSLTDAALTDKTKFGRFDNASVLRNAEAAWSFDELDADSKKWADDDKTAKKAKPKK